MGLVSAGATIEIRAVPLDSAEARTLIAALDAEMSGRYPEEGANHFRLDADEVAVGRGAFLVAALEDALVACGAVRCIEPGVAEIKRMYVAPSARRRGIARVLLERLEQEARALGATRVVLETGVRQPDALALYERAGYEPVEPWGEYVDSPLSVCLAKELVNG